MHWIFGYGSLIWRPDFSYRQARKAVLRGWQRRFWQASPDHRGVPAAPGRVVTIVEQREASCWGMAFEVAAAEWLPIVAMLDEREKNGYRPSQVSLDLDDGSSVTALTYIAGPDNPSFVGPAPPAEMAAQIAQSHGPSGSNLDYLLRLAETLETLGIHDEEVMLLQKSLTHPER